MAKAMAPAAIIAGQGCGLPYPGTHPASPDMPTMDF